MVLVEVNAVVVAADCPKSGGLRHELARLFAARWNMSPPQLLYTGLAVWLEATADGVAIDEMAGRLVCQPDSYLARLLEPWSFPCEADAQRAYLLAGGFTDFLIRRFGRDRYRDCYIAANHTNFRSRFEEHFDMSLEWAWQIWRESVPQNIAEHA
jgi:hypothetical protein